MSFSETVSDALKFYVYRLIDPRNNTTFYVGKGKGNRVFQHVEAAEKDNVSESQKNSRIQQILDADLTPSIIIHRHGLEESTAFEVEGALIDAYPYLVNDQSGHHNEERGTKTLREIKEQYELPELPKPDFKAIIINVNNIENRLDRESIYHQVRGHWVLNPKNAQKAEYVIAAYKQVAIGIFKPERWYPSDLARRYYFEGTEAPEEVWNKYVGQYGKRILNPQLKNGQNPIKYFNP